MKITILSLVYIAKKAEEEAKEYGYECDENVTYYWYSVSNQFLDTLHWDYDIANVK